MNTDEFAKMVLHGVETVGQFFQKPTDDWAPVMHIEDGEGNIGVGLIDPRFANSEAMKEAMVSAVGEQLERLSARKLAFINSMWMKVATPEELESEDFIRPNDDPDNRQEILIVLVLTKDEAVTYAAEIVRTDDKPPTLAEWERLDNFDSRFLDWQAVLA